MVGKAVIFLVTICFAGTVYCQSSANQPNVVTCGQFTGTRPQIGNSFRGLISNEDYAFSARIPNGLTGWSGVDSNAPFHGFTIFLDLKMEACIDFEVHIRVEEGDSSKRLSSGRTMMLGQAQGWQTVRDGEASDSKLTNIRTSFSFKHLNHFDDGEVLLIVPPSRRTRAKALYDEFVRSIKFGQ